MKTADKSSISLSVHAHNKVFFCVIVYIEWAVSCPCRIVCALLQDAMMSFSCLPLLLTLLLSYVDSSASDVVSSSEMSSFRLLKSWLCLMLVGMTVTQEDQGDRPRSRDCEMMVSSVDVEQVHLDSPPEMHFYLDVKVATQIYVITMTTFCTLV